MNPPERVLLADLVHRYAAAVDDRRFDDAAALFADDAELIVADPPRSLDPVIHHRGPTAIRAALAAVAAVERTEHAIVGEVYTAAGPDRARGRITCVAHHWSLGNDSSQDVVRDLVWHLRYDDDYVRSGPKWLFSVRTLTINVVETRPARRLRPR